MFSLVKKEINSFLGGLTGYLVIALFLILNALYLWVLPGYYNIPDSGYASIDGLFALAPWLYLILIPAITMRSFSEEIHTGTFELIVTKPLSMFRIVISKYIAGFILVLLSLIPTLLNIYAIHELGYPKGNYDTGGIIGSYIGLIFLASVYLAIGLFSSSIAKNQIVSFVLAIIVTLLVYIGFETLASLEVFGDFSYYVQKLGVDSHYKSISRGVVDSRDLFYFISSTLLFLYLTKIILSKKVR